MKSTGIATVLVLAAHVLAWAAFAFWVFVPSGTHSSIDPGPDGRCSIRDGQIDPGPDGECKVTEYSSTLLEDEGPRIIWVLLFPVLLTVTALVAVLFVHRLRWLRNALLWGSALVFLGFSLLSGFSIGLFYMPGALVLVVAAGVDLSRQGGRTTSSR